MSKFAKTLRPGPSLETMEERLAPAVGVGVNAANDLVITSNAASDHVVVSYQFSGGQWNYRVTNFGFQVALVPLAAASGGDIIFNGNAGNDYFRNDTAARTTALGGTGNDTLIGGSNVDYLFGGDGNDRLEGRAGNDWLYGQNGNDVMIGSYGNDHHIGGAGVDWADISFVLADRSGADTRSADTEFFWQ